MKIKMNAKENKNLKNKISIKSFFVSKNSKNNKPKIINIQTINIEKTPHYFKEEKNNFSKNINNIRYLNNSSLNNYNIMTKNDYFHKQKRNSFFNSFESEQSPINSDHSSSSNISSSNIRFRKRQYHKKFKKIKTRYKNEYIINNDSNISIHNLSFNTSNSNNSNNLKNININNNISFINSSSSSSVYDNNKNENNYSDSMEESDNSRDNKRKKYLDKMMVEENELDYLKKSEVGLNTSEDDDNNNSLDNNSNSIEENFNNEIERILIEIYNKNISLISSGNLNEINKNNGDIEDIEKQIKKYLKRENFKTNLLVLKSLSNKIKELVGKYKEKIFEIEELKSIQNTLKRQIISNEQTQNIRYNNNSLESNLATNSNSNASSYNGNYDDKNIMKNSLILNPQEKLNKKGVTYILLRELINIKRTLKISSKEIEGIFKYPLNILKNENGKKIKFSVELMQREEFCNILLKDDLISALLSQIKDTFGRSSYQKINKWILELEENYQHKNEMARFVKYINEKLPINNNLNNNNNLNDKNYLEDILYNKDKIEDNLYNSSIVEKKTYMEESTKKTKKKRNKKLQNDKIEEKRDELEFKDIDEILNYINDETDSKKGKKKYKKGKKNKNIKKEEKENKGVKNDNINNNNNSENINNFDIEFEKFKEEITKTSIYIYEINGKIKPCLSENFLKSISII